ncbi:MAG: GNAT family N-acetyltransferase [Paracoccaceae bacterium]
MIPKDSFYQIRIARSEQDLRAAQRLRYRVFVEELGGDGPMVDHVRAIERDEFDPLFDHLILIDRRLDPRALDYVVGVYRMQSGETGRGNQRFYSASEYDLSCLHLDGRSLLELGRSCVHRDYRGGAALYHLWNGVADYVSERDIKILFGVASFHGTDIAALAGPLSYLYHHHLAPRALRVRTRPDAFQRMDLMAKDQIDRLAAMKAIPALIKAYLRFGGYVGDGAFVDYAFNTTDICLVLDTARINPRQRAIYIRDYAA